MVSQDSPPTPSASMLHQFIVSDSMNTQNQFENQDFNAYASGFRGSNTLPHSLGMLPSINSVGERMSRSIDLVAAPAEESEMSHTRHLMDLLGAAANETNHHQARCLSLSLGSHMLLPSVQYRQRSFNSDFMSSPTYLIPGEEAREDSFGSSAFASPSASLNRACSTSYGTESFSAAIGNSRYLRPAQALLEELVNVGGRAVDISNEKLAGKLSGAGRGGALGSFSELCNSRNLSAEKQELQIKIAKLISLLEEVEGRYEKYCRQLEEVASSFEEIAGVGASKSYTALALQAMSRHFCSLRDAIVSQISVNKRKFLQDLPKINTGLSQLSLVDKESGHNRMSLQQLGLIQSQRHQAWRPIRGLPDSSVAMLRSWLFEHFLHPYPNDMEKLMLASQTGLTKNQVSNWFINARVRLWKPMIEEMYKEEFADSSEDSNTFVACSSSMSREDITDQTED